MLEANRIILDGLVSRNDGSVDETTEVDGVVVIGKGSRVTGSVLRGPLIIGEDCVIENATIGSYTSIHNRVTIQGSKVEHSILLEGSRLIGLDRWVESSLLGKDVEIIRSGGPNDSYRFLVGDLGRIEVG